LQLAFYGPAGSGKTFSALLFAAGLAPDGKVVVIDSERGRASLYADNKKILSALPQGFDVIELEPPYHPKRYVEAIDIAESSGYKVCLIDSGSDSWDGPGGCTDIAEAAKGMWAGAKLANKRMMARVANSDMHVIWCLKAQAKTKIIDKTKSESGKQEYIDLGVLPIWEKNNFYPQLLAFSVDPETHLSTVKKCHDDLWAFFPEPKLITKVDGERIRRWNESGQPLEANEQLIKRSKAAAEQGMDAYKQFFGRLTAAQRKTLEPYHAENKATAEKSDRDANATETPRDEDSNGVVNGGNALRSGQSEAGADLATTSVNASNAPAVPVNGFPDIAESKDGDRITFQGLEYVFRADVSAWRPAKAEPTLFPEPELAYAGDPGDQPSKRSRRK
jgi:hypothetical protein